MKTLFTSIVALLSVAAAASSGPGTQGAAPDTRDRDRERGCSTRSRRRISSAVGFTSKRA